MWLKTKNILEALTVFIAIVLSCVLISGCSHQDPKSDEYVGVWACYKATANTVEGELNFKSIDDVWGFLTLRENGDAEIVVRIIENEQPSIIECKWITTHEDRRTGEEAGVLLLGDDFENPYTYFHTTSSPNLINERLIDGNLVIDYGHRKEYLEKISNDPDYQPWILDNDSTDLDNSNSNGAVSDSRSTYNLPSDAIRWNDASSHVGETITIYGSVVGAEYASSSNGRPTFLDVGVAYPNKNRLSITIWGKNRAAFSPSPEALYEGKTICVTGEVYLYNGVCNIEVTSPSQIQVL